MEMIWSTNHINPQNLINISRGDKSKILKYLHQFQELVPPRMEKLKKCLAAKDRKMIRQIFHQMSPQLQFFGIADVVNPIQRLEQEYQTMSMEDLASLVNDVRIKIDEANKEIAVIVKNNFK